MKSRKGLFYLVCLLLLATGVIFRSSPESSEPTSSPESSEPTSTTESSEPTSTTESSEPTSTTDSPGRTIPSPELLEPLLLRDHAEMDAYLAAFPADSYDIADVTGLGRFYVDRFIPPGPIKSALQRGTPFEEESIDLMGRFIRPGQIVLDVGAHIGALAIPMAGMVGNDGLVFAVEPQKKMFRELYHNLRLNEVSNVVPLRYALGDTTDIVEMNPPPPGNEGGTSVGSGGDRVELRTLDSFSLPPLSFIKIDVEGFEDQVLDGAGETIRRSGFPPLLVEIQGGRNYVNADRATREKIDGTRQRMEALGYHVIWAGSFMYMALPPSIYEIGTAIDFSVDGDADQYQTGYWSQPDASGRWFFDDCPAGVVLRLPNYPVPEDLELAFWGMLAADEDRFSRDFVLSVNGTLIEEWNVRDSPEPQTMHPKLIIPKELTVGGLLRIEIVTRERGGGSGPERIGRSRMGIQQMALLFNTQGS